MQTDNTCQVCKDSSSAGSLAIGILSVLIFSTFMLKSTHGDINKLT